MGEFDLMTGLYVFVLAALAGREVITKVPPTLHTPLMSGANAISGIAIVGAIIVAAKAEGALQVTLGVIAIAMATINVIGGFMVTDRMLAMFKKR
ncbi:MAG: NAD(P) transhydrogenase subunit alpha [Gemmatimonadota bacterium]|jgi:NAD(P) transhydrogenase subunit alpha|uniref:proton-translocating NAD(P)(+) transhydrogenase n=1 Tax=marine metagenome TaxID=408172 RepID=A0A381NA40_9ZZZZ|nr:pyridine nucleotide transhydrogenase [Gemmatimonadota bacterium]MBU01477.1 pyridine nucleotide transhydrogenase [Gemmatimonadota bacterium]MCH2653204.1 NAD(P) transhydrogenase subunit alpha [Gemmatimonadota bacterium]MEC7808819.1 NAD(P) transhydrogenase subunit alpha [Gemmatimonadota bacterium]MEE3136381.1 NAD(P) transhydrogenase subunit alpha [Gemmatimonadota bacterium]|tara:strand:+ start:13878 stop:14162 length:285 start_codon:yes stop_codon:yes gene_type:complete